MRSIIAGGAGFIGSHLTRALIERGDDVIVVDDLSTGSKANLTGVMDDIEFIESDIAELDAGLMADNVYHLACVANPADYTSDPLRNLRTAALGTLRLLEIAESNKCRFCYFSSSEVYGSQDPDGSGTSEDSRSHLDLLTGRSSYPVAKIFAEEMVKDYSESNGLEYVIVRPFNIYGSRMDSTSPYGRVITNFSRAVADGGDLVINGDGGQTRSFCHIDDFVRGILSLDGLGRYPCVPINIGDPHRITINELADIFVRLSGGRTRIVHTDPVEHEPRHRMPDISLMHELTGWAPAVPLENGIANLLGKDRPCV